MPLDEHNGGEKCPYTDEPSGNRTVGSGCLSGGERRLPLLKYPYSRGRVRVLDRIRALRYVSVNSSLPLCELGLA